MFGAIAGGIASALAGGAMSKLFGGGQKAASGGFFFSSRRRHTSFDCDWNSDVCSSDLLVLCGVGKLRTAHQSKCGRIAYRALTLVTRLRERPRQRPPLEPQPNSPLECVQMLISRPCRSRSEERRVGKEFRSRWLPQI